MGNQDFYRLYKEIVINQLNGAIVELVDSMLVKQNSSEKINKKYKKYKRARLVYKKLKEYENEN